jgi:hypothetical protein
MANTDFEPWHLPHMQNRANDAQNIYGTSEYMAKLSECRNSYAAIKFCQRSGGEFVDTAQMLATGAIEGPFKTIKPVTLTLRQRIDRWIRRHLIDDMPESMY